MKVIAAVQVTGQGVSDAALKRALSTCLPSPPRRTDRLTLMALLGAAPLKPAMHADSGVYVAATYPARPNMFALLDAVCVQRKLPKPFEFVNSVSNAAGFHIAQQLGINGPNLFIGAGPLVWDDLLELASCDLEHAHIRQALLMHCHEGDGGNFCVQSLLLRDGGDTLSGRSFEALSSSLDVQYLELTDAG